MFQTNANNKDAIDIHIENENQIPAPTMLTVSGVILDEIPNPDQIIDLHPTADSYKSITQSHGVSVIVNHEKQQKQAYFPFDEPFPSIPSKVDIVKHQSCVHHDIPAQNDRFNAIFIPSQVIPIQNTNNLKDVDDIKMPSSSAPKLPALYNPFTSFSVNIDCKQLLIQICQILSRYSTDIEYKVKSDEYRVDGVVFMTDHHEVFFMISIFSEKSKKSKKSKKSDSATSKIEFIRKSGDSVSFARFYANIRDMIRDDVGVGDNGQMLGDNKPKTFVSDHIGFDGDYVMTDKQVQHELDEFYQDFDSNDGYTADFVRIFCHSKLGKSIKEQHILEHDKIINVLIERLLNSANICIVRGALIILTALIEKCNNDKIIDLLLKQNGNKLLNAIQNILSDQQWTLTKKYAIRLLSKLIRFKSEINWRNDQKLMAKYKDFKSEWMAENEGLYHGFNDFIQQQTFNQIETALFT